MSSAGLCTLIVTIEPAQTHKKYIKEPYLVRTNAGPTNKGQDNTTLYSIALILILRILAHLGPGDTHS